MRIFANQTNKIRTTQVLDDDGAPIESATVTVTLSDLDGTPIADGEITLPHDGSGYYSETLADIGLVAGTFYYIEGSIVVSGDTVWYMKRRIKAVTH